MLNQVFNEDCLIGMQNIPDKSIDMILCDLPYGTTACKWDVIIPFAPLWKQYERIIKDNGAIVLTGQEPFSSFLRCSKIEYFKYDWIWEKSKATNFLFAKTMPLKAHETVSVFYKKLPTYNPQKVQGKPYDKGVEKRTNIEAVGKIGNGNKLINSTGERNPRTVIYYRTAESEGNYHPTQKPVSLFEYLIKTYTKEGETVLDNCMGSGTTAIACINTNRNYIGFEKEEKYYNIIQERIASHKDILPNGASQQKKPKKQKADPIIKQHDLFSVNL